MFKELLKTLDELKDEYSVPIEISADIDGYLDRECPKEDCLSKFKVNEQDWERKVSNEKVYCPFCGHEAPANAWWVTEHIEMGRKQVIQGLETKIEKALEKDSKNFNKKSSKGLISMSMKFTGTINAISLPIDALEEMEQKISCEECGTRYAVIGSAFYCPCCGHNSAKQTFFNTLDKVNAKMINLETIRITISEYSKDEAARTCMSLIESSIPDLVVAMQRLCECVYPKIEGAKQMKKNVFQRLDDGNNLWKELVGKGYIDWIEPADYELLKKCFQQRHVLQHKDGIVDLDYINKSADNSYKVGQHLIIKKTDIMLYAYIVSQIGTQVLSLIQTSQME